MTPPRVLHFIFAAILTSICGIAQAKNQTPKPKFVTKEITSKTPGHSAPIKVNIKGWKTLTLVAYEGESMDHDHAVWATPKLIGPKGTLDLTERQWAHASSGWGKVRKNKCACGTPLKLDGKPVSFGIGAHASSVITYDLPPGYETFIVTAGIDDSGLNDGKSKPSITFGIFDTAISVEALPVAIGGKKPTPDYYPAEQLIVPEGLEATLWAKSPLFYNPTNMDIDAQGRIWVAEGRNYRRLRTQKGGDRVVVVEDKDGDGTAESSHVFVQEPGFISPLGIAVIDNKVIVSQPPDLIVYTDVDRNAVFDPTIDKRDILLTGFGGKNHDHSLHSVTVGPNGQYYFNHGNKGASVTDRDGWQLNAGSFYSLQNISGKASSDGQVYLGGVALRVNPDGTGMRPIGHNFRNSYEQAVSSFGDIFQNDNDDPPACRTTWLMEYGNLGFTSRNGKRNWRSDILPGQTTQIAEWRQEDPGVIPAGDVYGGGSPTGIAIYENGILEKQYGGYVISCEPARNTLFGYHPKAKGAGITLPQRDIFLTSNPKGEFAGADFRRGSKTQGATTLFRPSDVTIGPDGALYVADWWDARVGGHGSRDKQQTGAIYRIAPKGTNPTTPKLNLSTIPGQIAALKSPSPNVRELGRSRLAATGKPAIPAVAKLLSDPNPFIQARATWLLGKLGPDGLALVEKRLSHPKPQARIVAFRTLRHENHRTLEHAAALAQDPDAGVRREVAIAMRYVPFEKSRGILLAIAARHDGQDRYYVEAFGIGATDKETKLYTALKAAHQNRKGFDPVYAHLVWRLHPVIALPELEAWALDKSLEPSTHRAMLFAISLIEAPQAAASMVRIARSGTPETQELAKAMIEKRNQGIWNTYKPLDLLSGKKAGPTTYQEMLAPTAFGETKDLPDATAILALEGDAKRGKAAVGSCYTCHQLGSSGIEFGPALTGWGSGQSRELILKSILEPSADLAHGFEGTELLVKGNKRIQGFIQAEGNPIVIRVFGGKDIVVDANDIVSRKKLKQSLMIPANKLGLTPQQLRDAVEFLKHN